MYIYEIEDGKATPYPASFGPDYFCTLSPERPGKFGATSGYGLRAASQDAELLAEELRKGGGVFVVANSPESAIAMAMARK